MKIGITCAGKTMDDAIDARFGRCPFYLIVDSETMALEAVENVNQAVGGAGIQSAQLLLNHNVNVVLTGNCGPNAFKILEKGNVQVITGLSGSASEAVQQLKDGFLKPDQSANVQGHFGMGMKRNGGIK